jgi:16S rRNA (guanine1207-N2)-methyltransferase
MASEHYFSETPGSDYKLKEIQVVIDGASVTVQTAGGIFSPDHIDQGTAVLLNHLDEAPPGGNVLDIGCGWGPIALSLAKRSPKALIWAVDVNERSLALTRANAQRLGIENIRVCKPEEVPTDLTFDGIWSNPPIRVGKDVLHGLMLHWLPRLNIDADAYLVVQKNLGADSLHRWLEAELPSNFSTIRVDSAKSFRVLRVRNRG